MIDVPDDSWRPSDMAFQMFLDTVSPEQFSTWEWRLYQQCRRRIEMEFNERARA